MTPKVPDPGHREADKELYALTRRLNISYRQARIDLYEKIEKYLEQFEKKDAMMRALYDSGELSHEDFLKWRQTEIIDTKHWRNMLEQLSVDLTHQNQIAASMINDALPEVYAINHNYGTFEAEVGSGYDTTYTLYDRNVVKKLLMEHEDLLPHPSVPIEKDLRWNRQHLQSAVLQGILSGESMPEIAERFQGVTNMLEKAAIRNARTAVTGAENAGRIDSYIRAESMGIKMKQMWMATLDGRTRDSHVIMDGKQVNVGETFQNGCRYPGDPKGAAGEVYNCFIGDTKIATDSEIIRSYKHEYSGEIITVKTARGVEFSCTKNHPILTPNGWVRADSLHERDSVLVTFVGDGHLSGTNPNVNHVFPRIDTIHKFFNKIGSKRTRNLGVNFHGDIPTTDVEIITSKRFLRNNRNISKTQNVNEILFKCSNSFTFGNSHFMKRFRGICITSLGFISKSGERISFFWRRVCHTIVHSFRTITRSNTVVPQPEINNMSCDAKFLGNRLDGSSAVVLTDYIVNINISTVSHVPVYNLQTENGYYFVNSIISQKCNGVMAIVHNCRCTLVAVVEGAAPYNPNLRPSEYLKDAGLTYEQWKEMHGERYYSHLFKDSEVPESYSFADLVGNAYSGSSYTPEQLKQLQEKYENMPDWLKKFYHKYGGELQPIEENNHGKKPRTKTDFGYFSPFEGDSGKVHFLPQRDFLGRTDQYPFELGAHEYGHNIDFLAGGKNHNDYLSNQYRSKDGKTFLQIINDDFDTAVSALAGKSKITPDFIYEKSFEMRRNLNGISVDTETFTKNIFRQWSRYNISDPQYLSLKDRLGKAQTESDFKDFYFANKNIFCDIVIANDNGFIEKTYGVNKNDVSKFCSMIRGQYNLRERGCLSDMFENYSINHGGPDFPFGIGHGKAYANGIGATEREAFGEIIQSIIMNPDSLALIQKYTPNAYDAFREMIEQAVNR